MNPTEEQILKNIIAIRNRKGYSQEYLATQLGMKQSGYGHIEKGDRRLPLSLLLQIAVVFEMHIVDVILYPNKHTSGSDEDIQASLTIQLSQAKKEQVLKMVFGDSNVEILKK